MQVICIRMLTINRDLQHLRERITLAFATVRSDMIQRTWLKVNYRLDVSKAGAHCNSLRCEQVLLN